MTSGSDIDRRFRRFRIQEVATMTVVYAIFYVCRLAFSAAKKDMIELGAYTTDEIGWIGSSLLIAYAIGKCVNGFFADRANITRFMGIGLFILAYTQYFYMNVSLGCGPRDTLNMLLGYRFPKVKISIVRLFMDMLALVAVP